MRLLRTVIIGLSVFVFAIPLRSEPPTESPKPGTKEEPAEKVGQPFFKMESALQRKDSPQTWGGFQTQSMTPHGPFLAPMTFAASPTTPTNLYDPSGYGNPYTRPLYDDSQARMLNYMYAQQSYMAYTQWRNARSTRSTGIALPGVGGTSGGDACTPGASMHAHFNAVNGFRPGNPFSQCFVRGTVVALSSGEHLAIDEIHVGQRVSAGSGEATQAIDHVNWRQVELTAIKRDGSTAEMVLLRPLAWLESHKARSGEVITLDLPGCGFTGTAMVTALRPCPAIQSGTGAVVTATLRHSLAAVVNLHVNGLAEPIATTAGHRFWSEDRAGFVRADEMQPGERLRGRNEIARVLRLESRPTPQAVYNLEVAGQGMYHVSRLELLVRDAGTSR